MSDELIKRLRYMGRQYAAGQSARGGGAQKHYLEDAADHIESQQREIEALRADAERYRWLRACHWFKSPLCVVLDPKISVRLGVDCPSLDRLDQYIDEQKAKDAKG